MGNSCLIAPLVRTRTGEIVRSPLFMKLQENFGRDNAKLYYKLSRDKKFRRKIEENSFIIKNDNVPSELDFDYFVKVTGIGNKSEELQDKINSLNATYAKTGLNFEDALNESKSFNRNEEYNSVFMCNVVRNATDPKLYDIEIVQKIAKNEVDFENFIKKETYLNTCLSIISRLGYNIGREYSEDKLRFVISDPEKGIKIFESIIDETDLSKTTDELLYNFCDFVYKLEKAKKENVIILERAIKEINDKKNDLKEDNAEDYFIRLMVDTFKSRTDNNGANIIDRAVNYLKNKISNFFSLLKGINVSAIKKDADYIIRNYFNGSKINIEMESDNISVKDPLNQILTNATEKIKILVEKFNATGDKEASKKTYDIFVKNVLNNYVEIKGFPESDIKTIEKILSNFKTYIEGLRNELSNYKNDPNKDRYLQIEVAKKIYEASCVYSAINFITEDIDSFFNNILKSDISAERKKMYDINEEIKEINVKFESDIKTLEVACYTTFLTSIYGSDYIKTKGGIVFEKRNRGYGFKKVIPESISIQDIVENKRKDTNESISLYREWLASAYDNTDIQCKNFDIANKMSENDINKEMQDEMKSIESITSKIFSIDGFGRSKQYMLFEKDENNINTGNYISKYNQYMFERDRKEFIRKIYSEWGTWFKEQLKAKNLKPKDISLNEKQQSWENYKKKKLKEWYVTPTEKGRDITRGKNLTITDRYGKKRKIWVAGDYYLNEKYQELIDNYDGMEEALNELIEFKYKQDKKLNGFGAPMYRAPQIDSYTTNMLANAVDDKSWKYIGSLLRRKIHNIFSINQNSLEWGSEVNKVDNLQDLDFFNQGIDKNSNGDSVSLINTLTIYGVKNLYDRRLITTDIIHGLIAYTNMATAYKYKNILMSHLNLGNDLLNDREIYKKIKNTGDEKKDYKLLESSARLRNQKRIDSYIKSNILGKRFDDPNVVKVIFKKIVHLGTVLALGGNEVTAAVNLGTGITDVIREGIASGKYSLKDLAKATLLYTSSTINKGVKKVGGRAISNKQTANEITDAYIDAFARRFDIQNKNRVNYNDIKAGRNYMSKLVGNIPDLLFAAYEFGDNVMRVLPSMAIFNNKKVHSLSGEEYSLLDIYQEHKDGVILYQSLNINDSETLNDIYDKINKIYEISKKTNQLINVNKLDFTDEEKEVLKKYNINIDERETLIILYKIRKEKEKLETFFLSENGADASKNRRLYLKINDILDSLMETNSADTVQEILKKNLDFIKNDLNIRLLVKTRDEVISALMNKKEDLMYNVHDETRIMAEIKSLLTDFHGIYDNIDATMLQSTYAGSLILGMKGYMLGYLSRSFVGYNKWTGKEGFMTTFAKAVLFYLTGSSSDESKNYIKQLLMIPLLCLSPLCGRYIINSMTKDGWSEYQAQNVVRCVTEMCIITSEILLRAFIKSKIAYLGDLDDDDELTEEDKEIIEEKRNALYRRLYMVERLLYERLAYSDPSSMKQEFQSVTNLLPSGLSVALSWGTNIADWINCKRLHDEIDDIFYEFQDDGSIRQLDPENKKDKSIIIKNIKDLEEQYPSLKGLLYTRSKESANIKVGDMKYKTNFKKKTPIYRDYYWFKNAEERYNSLIYFNNLKR